MRTRITMMAVLVTSTTMISNVMADNLPEILVHENTNNSKPKFRVTKRAMDMYNKYGVSPYDYDIRKQHKFIERFFPRNENELDNMLRFIKDKKKSVKLRNKKPLVELEALKVA